MNDPSTIAHEIQAAALQFRASHRTLRSYLPWASDATLLRLASEAPDEGFSPTIPPSGKSTNGENGDPSPIASAASTKTTAPTSHVNASSVAPKASGPLVFQDVTDAIRWAFGKRSEVLDEASVPSTSQDLYDYLRGATIAGKPISPTSFARCVASSKFLKSVQKVKDPHHSVRQLTVYELKDKASVRPTPEITPPAPIVTARIKQPSASASATLTPESLLSTPPSAPVVVDRVAEEVRSRLGLSLAKIGTDFLSAGDLFAECFKVQDPIHLADVESLMGRRAWSLNGRKPSIESLRRHTVPLMDKRLFHVGEDASARGRPRILYGSKPMPSVTNDEVAPISQTSPEMTPGSPASASTRIASTASLTQTIRTILREMGPLTTTEIMSTLKRMTTIPASAQQAERAQVVGVILRGRGTHFENKGAQQGQTMWGAMADNATRNALVKLPEALVDSTPIAASA